ncbi:histidine phosphatase superfamily [Collybia nuda]|uniref:Histidine phosphatase superfamily n=1 Tax=Collybia nuda TaxID=64659 RepID=A0A9P6CLA9_9AGAR|nr:histidine phosphatase superfamily [Collybia nuda]
MLGKPDVDAEAGEGYTSYESNHERESLLPTISEAEDQRPSAKSSPPAYSRRQFGLCQLVLAFLAGTFACAVTQLIVCGPSCFTGGKAAIKSTSTIASSGSNNDLAPPWVGSTERHPFPPPSPTNAYPSLFPTSVGYAGGTPTGAEAAIVATAPIYPIHTGAAQLVVPATLGDKGKKGKGSKGFDMFKKWGNLSPWYSVDRTAFGLDSGPETPETCRVTGLHFLHRHGARYPTAWVAYGGPASFAGRLNAEPEKWNASGDLEFMNEWTYKLGEELLTPFGRQQLFDLGVSMRLKYGFLLKNFTETNTLPVFRTESQDRMLASALNFAIGFFGYPFKHQYQQSITIEAQGFNNTLAPYDTCVNANIKSKSDRGIYYISRWAEIYLKAAHARLQPQLKGFNLRIEDVFTMQQTCAYETVALGYSKFCELFTEEEWDGFDYALDLSFWYGSAFGSPVARVQGIGWVQELVARLTHTPIATHNSSTNATLNDNPITFPLGQSLYVDATHEVVILNIITALNLTNFATTGPLPYDHIPKHRSFITSQLSPFSANMQFQLLECTSVPGPQIRIIINDGVTPLTGIKGCPEQRDGMCPVDTFVAAQKEIIAETDWNYGCNGDWEVLEGPNWNTTTGSPPPKH